MLSLPVSITTTICLFSVNKNPYKPSFATVTGSIKIYGNTREVHQIPKINSLPFWLRIDQPLSSQTFCFAQTFHFEVLKKRPKFEGIGTWNHNTKPKWQIHHQFIVFVRVDSKSIWKTNVNVSDLIWIYSDTLINMPRKTSNQIVLSKLAKLSSLFEINQSISWWIRLKSEGPLKQKKHHLPEVFSNPPVAVLKVKKLRSVVNNGGAIPHH